MNKTTKIILIVAAVLLVVFLVYKFKTEDQITEVKSKGKKQIEASEDESDATSSQNVADKIEAERLKKITDEINARIKRANASKPLAIINRFIKRK